MIQYKDLMHVLNEGKENGISRKDLAEIFHVSQRDITKAVTNARIQEHIIILSGNNGYYLPKNDEEVKEFYFHYRTMGINVLKGLKDTRLYLKDKGLLDSK